MEIRFVVSEVAFPKGLPAIPGFIVSAPKIRRKDSDIKKLAIHRGAAFGFEDTVLHRALSEAIERFSISIYDKKSFLCASMQEMKFPFIAPSNFILFADSQYQESKFPFTKPGMAEDMYWVSAHNVVSKNEVYIPASFIYPSPTGKWVAFDAWTSNGLAAGENEDMVIVNGICELLERDSTMCWWMSRKNAIRVSASHFYHHDNIAKLVDILREYHLDLFIFLIRNDMGIITTVATIRSKMEKVFAFGSSCKLSITQSVEGSILEALMVARTQKIMQRRKYSFKKAVEKLTDHVMVPLSKKYMNGFNFFESYPIVSQLEMERFCVHHPNTSQELLNVVDRAGYPIYFRDVTPAILKDSNYIVGKVLVPGLHPLETNQHFLHLDIRRISMFCKYAVDVGDLYTELPHPFG